MAKLASAPEEIDPQYQHYFYQRPGPHWNPLPSKAPVRLSIDEAISELKDSIDMVRKLSKSLEKDNPTEAQRKKEVALALMTTYGLALKAQRGDFRDNEIKKAWDKVVETHADPYIPGEIIYLFFQHNKGANMQRHGAELSEEQIENMIDTTIENALKKVEDYLSEISTLHYELENIEKEYQQLKSALIGGQEIDWSKLRQFVKVPGALFDYGVKPEDFDIADRIEQI